MIKMGGLCGHCGIGQGEISDVCLCVHVCVRVCVHSFGR